MEVSPPIAAEFLHVVRDSEREAAAAAYEVARQAYRKILSESTTE